MRKRRPPKRRAPKGEKRLLTIDRLDDAGAGQSGTLSVPFALPGEQVEALVTGRTARVIQRLNEAKTRTKARCPHFGRPGDGCGGCTLQHLAPDAAHGLKTERLLSQVRSVYPEAELAAIHASPPQSRRRALFAIGPDRAGFRALGDRQVVPLTECLVVDPELFAELSPLRSLARTLGLSFDAQLTKTLAGIDMAMLDLDEATLDLKQRESIAAFAAERGYARVTAGRIPLAEHRQPSMQFGGIPVAMPTGVFLQATEQGQAALTAEVLEACQGKSEIADLFAGLGTFSLPLSAQAAVTAVDSAGDAIEALQFAAKQSGRAIRAEARDLFKRPLMDEELKACDAIVFDPPRAGAGLQAEEIAKSRAEVVVAVSCQPKTLARDLRPLAAAYNLTRLVLVDQFGWSAHIEAVAVLKRR